MGRQHLGEPVLVVGKLRLEVEDGRVAEGRNTITSGFQLMMAGAIFSALFDIADSLTLVQPITYPALGLIGTGTGNPSFNDTALFAQYASAPATGYSYGVGTVAYGSFSFQFPAVSASTTFTEAGVSLAGKLINHGLFTNPVTVAAGYQYLLTVEFDVS